MNPLCVKCRREMQRVRSGVSVAPEAVPTHRYRGDLNECPVCGIQVITGFGMSYYDPDKPADVLLVEPGRPKVSNG